VKLAFPGFANEIVPEAVMRLPSGLHEARLGVEVTRRCQSLLRPKNDFPVTGLPRESHTFGNQFPTNPEAARIGIHQ
jgi:hypothetical protein